MFAKLLLLVHLNGFEPMSSCLRGRRPKPLDDKCIKLAQLARLELARPRVKTVLREPLCIKLQKLVLPRGLEPRSRRLKGVSLPVEL